MDIKLAAIDGSGPSGEYYDLVMRTSFCRQAKAALGEHCHYQRGPSPSGKEVFSKAFGAYNWLKNARLRDPRSRLMLMGFSRGGSAALMAAEMLERDHLEIDSMFLFDAVGRHPFRGGRRIPSNVRFSRHARRLAGGRLTRRPPLDTTRFFGSRVDPARPRFGNIALDLVRSGDHRMPESFLGSHGALGGVGWEFVCEDAECELAVAAWMNEWLGERATAVNLLPLPMSNRTSILEVPLSHFLH